MRSLKKCVASPCEIFESEIICYPDAVERQRQNKTEPEDRFPFYIHVEDPNAEEVFVPKKTFHTRLERLTTSLSLVYRAPAEMNVSAAFGSSVRGTLLARAGMSWFLQDLMLMGKVATHGASCSFHQDSVSARHPIEDCHLTYWLLVAGA